MAEPTSEIPFQFYRAAFQRIEEAEILFLAGKFHGAVYLAGYTVECMLKTLILIAEEPARHEEIERTFRSRDGHDYERLRQRYEEAASETIPENISLSLAFVSTWEPSLRYHSAIHDRVFAEKFLNETRRIMEWVDGQIPIER